MVQVILNEPWDAFSTGQLIEVEPEQASVLIERHIGRVPLPSEIPEPKAKAPAVPAAPTAKPKAPTTPSFPAKGKH